jgi:hypothetical protein
MIKTGLEFGFLVIVICLIFGICDLEFLFLQYSKKARNSKAWGRFLCGHLEMLYQMSIGADL